MADHNMAIREWEKGKFAELVRKDEVRKHIEEKFRDFLLTALNPYAEDEQECREPLYPSKIRDMVSRNESTLEVDHSEFMNVHHGVWMFWFKEPGYVGKVMEEVVNEVVYGLYPDYRKVHEKITLRMVPDLQPYRSTGTDSSTSTSAGQDN